jgi:hypothetical protein
LALVIETCVCVSVCVRFGGDEDKPAAIQRQVAFYFSDSNLPLDTFLKGKTLYIVCVCVCVCVCVHTHMYIYIYVGG